MTVPESCSAYNPYNFVTSNTSIDSDLSNFVTIESHQVIMLITSDQMDSIGHQDFTLDLDITSTIYSELTTTVQIALSSKCIVQTA